MKNENYIKTVAVDEKDWYKDGPFWRHPNHDGSNGKGDLIFNTCNRIVIQVDKSDWAKQAILYCWILLWVRKRWPDRMTHPMDAKSWFWRAVNRTVNKMFDTNLPFRAQKRMSRDPFKAWICACTVVGAYRKMQLLTIPFYLYRPATWSWYRFIRKGNRFWWKMYLFWKKFSFSKKDYVIRLHELMEEAADRRIIYNSLLEKT